MPRSRRYRRLLSPTGASVTDMRRRPGNGETAAPVAEPVAEPVADAAEPEVSYRDLQAKAKDAGIPANQSREDLEAALAEADT